MEDEKLDISKLHPKGVLEKFKELSTKELDPFIDREKGEIKEGYREYVNCPLCGSSEALDLYKINCFNYVQCSNCEMNYVNPRLDSTRLQDRHFSESYNFMFDNLLLKNFEYRVNVIAKKKVDKIEEYRPSKGKLLDIGCGAGDFLAAARNSGWDVVGVETNEKVYNYVTQQLKLRIYRELENDDFKSDFNVITLWGVIEHLKDPVYIMRRCHEYLKENGLLIIETHNLDSLTAEYQIENPECVDRIMEGDKHILNFNSKTLTLLLEKTNFKLSYSDSLGLDVVTILRYLRQTKPEITDSAIFRHFEKYAEEHQAIIDKLMHGDHIRVFAIKG